MKRLRLPLLVLSLMMLVPAASWAQQEALGRLFMTPQQRAALDQQRLRNPGLNPDPIDTEASQTFNGEVRRSNGRNTHWINGQVNWGETAPAPRIPVGDTFIPETGERESLLGGGRITIKRPSGETPRP